MSRRINNRRKRKRINASFESKVARTEKDGTINNEPRRSGCPRCGGGTCTCNRNNTPKQEPGCGCGRNK